jgi:hypothetical protein
VSRRTAIVVLLVIVSVSGTLTAAAMRHTSTTFDEIVFVAGGLRGFETGRWDLVPDHPPLMQYVYGALPRLAGTVLPDESGVPPETQAHMGYRYAYAAAVYWGVGNDPERIAFLSRIPAVLMALGLVSLTFFFVAAYWNPLAGVLAAALVAFLPDTLAHGGVAYSDLPVTLAFLAGLWATDLAVRTMDLRRAAAAGAIAGLAVATKISAAALLPAAILIVVLEVLARRYAVPGGRWPDSAWLRRLAGLALIATMAAYLALVLVYRGDFLLEQFRWGLDFRYHHMMGGHGAYAVLLDRQSPTGWWYFFPVAFLFKTSAGLHVLLAIAAVTLISRARTQSVALLTSPLRVPAVGLLVFGTALLTSNLNIGFRYALPVLPFICIGTAVGVHYAWRRGSRLVRGTIAAASIWAVAFPITFYPHFLGFISEYGPGYEHAYEVLVDSSLDWGQGLLELRSFMQERDIPVIYLSYFGSAHPAGYGIEYVPLPSFFPLPERPPPPAAPEWIAISATNLRGAYLAGDPFAAFRDVRPDAVLARSIYVYHLGAVEDR